jgi:hypothetical protein
MRSFSRSPVFDTLNKDWFSSMMLYVRHARSVKKNAQLSTSKHFDRISP